MIIIADIVVVAKIVCMCKTQCSHKPVCTMQEAVLALNEAVRIAQQHNDNVALAHALGALCHILATAAPAAVTQLTEAGTAAVHPSGHLSQLLKILKRYGSVTCKCLVT